MTDERGYAPTLATLGELVDAHRAAEGERPLPRDELYRRPGATDRVRRFVGDDIADFIEERPFISALAAFAIALVVGHSISTLTRPHGRS